MFRFTGNIYNDFKMYEYQDIFKRVSVMMSSSEKNCKRERLEGEIIVKYTVSVLINSEQDDIQYEYNTLNEAITATYFLNLLVEKKGYAEFEGDFKIKPSYKGITIYQMFTTIKDYTGEEVYSDVTDNFNYWKPTDSNKKDSEIEALREEIELYKNYTSQFNITKRDIIDHNKKAI